MTLNKLLSIIDEHFIFNKGLFVKDKFNKIKWLDKEGLKYLCTKFYNFGYEQRNLDI